MRDLDTRAVAPAREAPRRPDGCVIGCIAGSLAYLMVVALIAWSLAKPEVKEIVVEYVVPDGYRGLIETRENRTNGIAPEVFEEKGRTVYRYVIPQSGVLVTSDMTPMHKWHKVRASYYSRRVLPAEGFQRGEGSDVMLRGLTDRFDLVGTDEEEKQFQRLGVRAFRSWWERQGISIPPGAADGAPGAPSSENGQG